MKANRKKLQIAMAHACLILGDVEKVSGFRRRSLNNVITGRNVRPGTLGRVAKALGCKVTEILED